MEVIIFTTCFLFGTTIKSTGSYLLASKLRKKGYKVLVIDQLQFFSRNELISLIDKFVTKDTKMIGFSSTFFTANQVNEDSFLVDDLSMEERYKLRKSEILSFSERFPFPEKEVPELLDYIKSKAHSKMKILYGGAKADSPYWNKITKTYPIDYFVKGYSEDVPGYLLDYHFKGEPLPKGIELSKNIANPHAYDVKFNPKNIEEFALSPIEYDETDRIVPYETLGFEYSRGCPLRCGFCAYWLNGRAPNTFLKSPETVYLELMNNYERFGVTKYVFGDDIINESTEKLEKLVGVVERLPFELEYCVHGRIDFFEKYPEQIDLLEASGLKAIKFGLETINDESGRWIGKGLGTEKTLKLFEKINDSWKDKIAISASIMLGLPGDTLETIEKDIDWYLNEANNYVSHLSPYPVVIRPPSERFGEYRSNPSLFELNPEKYGYDLSAGFNWAHKNGFDFNTVSSMIEKHREEFRQKNILDAYMILLFMGNDMTFEEACKVKFHDVDRATDQYKFFEKTQSYKDFILSY